MLPIIVAKITVEFVLRCKFVMGVQVYHNKLKPLLFIVSTLVVSCLLEVALRLFAPQRTLSRLKQTQLSCYQSSSTLPYEYRPNCRGQFITAGVYSKVRINNMGLRGPDIEEHRKKRVLVIGDSYAFGYGVEEEHTLPSQLSDKLDAEVINGGVWGFGPDSEYLMMRHFVPLLQPNLVILTLFPRNDLRDLAVSKWTMADDRILTSIKNDKFVDSEGFLRRDTISRRYYIPIIRESHLAAFTIDRIENAYSNVKYLISRFINGPKPDTYVFDDPGWDDDCLFRDRCQGLLMEARDKAEKTMGWLKEFSDNIQVPLLVVMIPAVDQAHGSAPTETVFHKLAVQEQMNYLDLSDAFIKSGETVDELYLPDRHWSPEGNAVAAQAITEYLEKTFPQALQ